MVLYAAVADPDRCPTHPGELLREDVLPALARSKSEIAALLGISRQHLYEVLAGRKPVSTTLAVRLGKLLGNGPTLWLGMQSAYDIWQASRREPISS